MTTMQAYLDDFSKLPYNARVAGGRPTEKQPSFLGGQIAKSRELAGLSQNELADKLAISRSQLAQWERTAVSLKAEQLSALSAALNVSADVLIGREKTKRSGPIGRARKIFEELSALPQRQQDKILTTIEDLIIAQKTKCLEKSN